MIRALRFLFASFFSAVAGFAFGIVAAGMYQAHYYPGDPDPVDFTIGGILLAFWLGGWFIGTIYSGWAVYFGRPNQSFKPNPLRGSA